MLIRVTVAVQDAALCKQLQKVLARPDILVQTPVVRKDLWERIVREPSDLLIISQSLLQHLPKNKKFSILNELPDSPALVVLSDHAESTEQAELLAAGCDAVLYSGLAVKHLLAVIEPIIVKRRRITQKFIFATQPLAEPRLSDFVSRSASMANFMKLVPRMVRSDTTLLIEGETGVGKERLAHAIHAEGPRAAERFIALNCGALPEHLLESELFGHVRGAFTGATSSRRGWFEVAHRGTLFLDEVSEIPLHLQVKLLRVLQERQIQPVGGEKAFPVEVRIIAASNRPLATEIEAGRFRRDLFHRLSVVTITIPPLRERIEDIPHLVQRLIEVKARELRRKVHGIGPAALKALCSYSWPGNLRELNNVIERAILLCDDSDVGLETLPELIAALASGAAAQEQHRQEERRSSPGFAAQGPNRREERRLASVPRRKSEATGDGLLSLPEHWLKLPLVEMRNRFFSDLERQYIAGMLKVTRGRVGVAAKRAGLPERSLYEKMQLYNLRKEDFRNPNGSQDAVPSIADASATSEASVNTRQA